MKEKEIEAKIQGIICVIWMTNSIICFAHSVPGLLLKGVEVTHLKLEQADCEPDERVYW